MNRKTFMFLGIAAVLAVLLAMPAGSVFAAGDSKKMSSTPRASELIGKTVKNDRGAELGEVEDVVIGRYQDADYLIIKRDAVGQPERLVPVPFHSANLYFTEDNVILSGIDKARLDNAPSFSADEWRMLDDQRFRSDVRGYYGQTGTTPRTGEMTVLPLAGELIGKTVKNEQGANLGEVSDVAIGRDREVDYLIISRHGAAGRGERLIPVPLHSANMYVTKDSVVLRGIDQAMLDNAPSFSEGEWRMLDNQRFRTDVRGYYGAWVYRQDYYPRGYMGTPPPSERGSVLPPNPNPDDLPPKGQEGPTPGSSGSTVSPEQRR